MESHLSTLDLCGALPWQHEIRLPELLRRAFHLQPEIRKCGLEEQDDTGAANIRHAEHSLCTMRLIHQIIPIHSHAKRVARQLMQNEFRAHVKKPSGRKCRLAVPQEQAEARKRRAEESKKRGKK